MKKYKLLKNMPFAKAGEELYLKFSEDSEFFLVYKGTNKAYTAELNPRTGQLFNVVVRTTKTGIIIAEIRKYKE